MTTKEVSLVLKAIGDVDIIIPSVVDSEYNFLDLIIFLLKCRFNNPNKMPIKNSGIRVGKSFVTIRPDNLNEKLIDYVEDDIVELREVGVFTAKNDFEVIGNIIDLYSNNLLETVNIMDVCSINHAKIGEWIGFGRGPCIVPDCDNNRIQHLIFIQYGIGKPVAYNIHCLNKMVDISSESLLIPHINKRINASKFNEICKSIDSFKVLKLDGNDIVLEKR